VTKTIDAPDDLPHDFFTKVKRFYRVVTGDDAKLAWRSQAVTSTHKDFARHDWQALVANVATVANVAKVAEHGLARSDLEKFSLVLATPNQCDPEALLHSTLGARACFALFSHTKTPLSDDLLTSVGEYHGVSAHETLQGAIEYAGGKLSEQDPHIVELWGQDIGVLPECELGNRACRVAICYWGEMRPLAWWMSEFQS